MSSQNDDGPGRRIELELILDHPNKLYASGDVITGTVNGVNNDNDTSLEIILEGRSKSYLAFKSQYGYVNKNRVPLVYQRTRIESSSEPRFEVTVPATTDKDIRGTAASIDKSSMYWMTSWAEDHIYETTPGHTLPPSLIMPKKDITELTHISGRGFIRYTLTVVQTQTKDDQEIQTSSSPEVIWITTPRMSTDEFIHRRNTNNKAKYTDRVYIANRLLDPAVEDRKLNWKESMKATVTDNPTICVMPMITVPKIAAVGEDITVYIGLKLGQESKFPLPAITMQQVNLHLSDTLGVRVKRSIFRYCWEYDFPGPAAGTRSVTTRHVFQPTDDGKGYDGTVCEIPFTIPTSLIPSFKTYNFTKTWHLSVEVVFRCLKKEKRAQIQCGLDVISRPRSEEGQEDATGLAPAVEDRVDGLDISHMSGVFRGAADGAEHIGDMLDSFS